MHQNHYFLSIILSSNSNYKRKQGFVRWNRNETRSKTRMHTLPIAVQYVLRRNHTEITNRRNKWDKVNGRHTNNLKLFDTVLLEECLEDLQRLTDRIVELSEECGLK